MTTDAQLLARRLALSDKITDGAAAEIIANEYGLSQDSVRGRLSRARSGGGAEWFEVLRSAALDIPPISPSILRQEQVIARSNKILAETKADVEFAPQTGLFVSDVHYRYARWDALKLVQQIVADTKPTYISAQNDLLDNDGYSLHWEDTRTARGRNWSADVASARAVEEAHYRMLQEVSPYSLLVGVLGNHDRWYYDWVRGVSPQDAEKTIADYMEWMEGLGIAVFSNGRTENHVELSEKLVWSHGWATNKRPETRAKITLEHFIKNGKLRSVVVGHTHRPCQVMGEGIGLPGANFYNSGHLCRDERVPYMDRDPHGWALGVVYSEFTNDYEESKVVLFRERGKALVAELNGTKYEVGLNKQVPSEFL